jgi:4-diphosphocytidyl-2-C-methyl-D-erythritol kinase
MAQAVGNSVVVRVPGKINLQLSVGPKAADGYHGIVTVFQSISLYDDVAITKEEIGAGLSLNVNGDHLHGVPTDETNLAWRAAMLMCQKYELPADFRIDIKKSIPVAGGMAGGSADAAATILGIDALCSLGQTREDLHSVAAQLGSDVPFMLSGGTAVGRGRGDQVTSALSRGTYYWVLALSTMGLSTQAVYGECDRLRESTIISSRHC